MKKNITKITVSILSLALTAALVLPVLAQTAGTQNQNASKPDVMKTISASCVQNAIEKRDMTLVTAIDTYASAAKSALQVRKDAEKAAWNQTDRKARRDAMKATLTTYRNSVRAARKNFQNARKSVWTKFKTDRKVCGGSAGSEEFDGQGQDESL